MKKLLILALVSVFLVAAGTTVVTAEKITITMLNNPDPGQDVIDTAVGEMLMKKFPNVEFKYVIVPWAQTVPKVMAGLITGTGPDVFHNVHRFPPTLAYKGVTIDLGPYIERDKDEIGWDDIFAATKPAGQYLGVQHGMPWLQTPIMVYYNRDMFVELGLPLPKKSWSWDTVREVGVKLAKDFNGDGMPDQFMYDVNGHTGGMDHVCRIIWAFGGEVANEDRTRIVIDNPGARAAIEYILDNVDKYNISPTPTQSTQLAEIDLFNNGRQGMKISGVWDNPIMTDLPFRVGVTTIPAGPAGQFSRDGVSTLSITAASKNPDMAWEYIKLHLSEEGQLLAMGVSVPIHKSAASGPAWIERAPYYEREYKERNGVGVHMDTIENLCKKPMPITLNYNAVNRIWREEIEAILTQKKSVEKGLADMERMMNEALEEA